MKIVGYYQLSDVERRRWWPNSPTLFLISPSTEPALFTTLATYLMQRERAGIIEVTDALCLYIVPVVPDVVDVCPAGARDMFAAFGAGRPRSVNKLAKK